jgi:hypothetical protein
MKLQRRRSGYAMLMVLLFLILMFAIMAIACRQLESALRAESARALAVQRDEGSIPALAKALTLLETGLPPSNPYVCGTSIVTSTGTVSYTVTFTSQGNNTWSVQSTPTSPSDNPQPMPSTFAP